MTGNTFHTRLALVVLAALLVLPLAPTASPVEAKRRFKTITRTFRNPATIALPVANSANSVSADLYPSTIVVGGLRARSATST